MERSGLIQREETVYNGHNTYYLEPAARDLDFALLMAGDMLSPFIGEEEVDAQADAFSQWMMKLAYEEYYRRQQRRLTLQGLRHEPAYTLPAPPRDAPSDQRSVTDTRAQHSHAESATARATGGSGRVRHRAVPGRMCVCTPRRDHSARAASSD